MCLAGGVAANGRLRQLVNDGAQKLGAKVYLPELTFCGDNGAMIAEMCIRDRDNGSTDESLEQARSYCSRENFTLIENGTNTGFSHAVNQGIALADSEYVVLFNNDARAEPQGLEELIRTARCV